MDSKISTFSERCYELLKQVPKGKVTTYQEIAKGWNTNAWRAVGSAMAKNKNLFVIPWVGVVRRNGSVGQYALGQDKKVNLLIKEGVDVSNGKVENLGRFIHRFSS